ncbi:MAG TPA: FAD/NAD(P)-binding protein, partial [Stellaceae bacterium]|nr:FAD/NAD(P)-binding protein [Stellaceae bacterium]
MSAVAEILDVRPRVGREKPPVAVIGGGFSGTMAAIQLARAVPRDQPILLCERAGSFGQGVAYATAVPDHLLNVRAANMSAFAAEPGHFETWLESEGEAARTHRTEAGVFASRGTYGRYLTSILYDEIRDQERPGQLRPLPDDIVDCRRTGDGFELTSGSGRRYTARAVVLATGHVPSAPSADPRYVTNPWARGATRGLDDTAPVLVLGTGLTMVDVVVSLRQSGFTGPIIALSRHGLLPQPHEASAPWPMPQFTEAERGSVRLTMRRMRGEIAAAASAGICWRAVVDSIRPITAAIWRGWPEAERHRFLRHARRAWDVHRHRMAPPVAAAIDVALADGSLRVVAGRVSGMRFDADAVHVAYRPLGGGQDEIAVQRVIVATGLESAVKTTDPLTQRLIERGLV